MAVDAYTIESMAYLTTGLIDTRGAGSGELRQGEGRHCATGLPRRVLLRGSAREGQWKGSSSHASHTSRLSSPLSRPRACGPEGHVHRSRGMQSACLR